MGCILKDYVSDSVKLDGCDDTRFEFISYVQEKDVEMLLRGNPNSFACDVPLHVLAGCLTGAEMKQISIIHKIWLPARNSKDANTKIFMAHEKCKECALHCSVFAPASNQLSSKEQNNIIQNKIRAQKQHLEHGKSIKDLEKQWKKKIQLDAMKKKIAAHDAKFPPRPPSDKLLHKIITGFCKDSAPSEFEEAGCAVCGQLTPLTRLKNITDLDCDLSILHGMGVTRKERFNSLCPIEEVPGPVIDNACTQVCISCEEHIANGTVPINALANGLWLGPVPPQLTNLTFGECMLIARVKHNTCLVRVSSGRAKMTANAIMFSSPIVKVYHKLPPSREELDEVLAFVFMGSAQPTEEEFKRSPMFVPDFLL